MITPLTLESVLLGGGSRVQQDDVLNGTPADGGLMQEADSPLCYYRFYTFITFRRRLRSNARICREAFEH